MRIKSAHGIILGSYPVAGAIIKFIQKNKINKIYTCGLYGVEDQLFCEYLTARLIGEKYSLDPMMSYLKSDPEAQKFFDPNDLDHKIIDIYQAIAEDVFNFVPMESITNKIRTIVKHEI